MQMADAAIAKADSEATVAAKVVEAALTKAKSRVEVTNDVHGDQESGAPATEDDHPAMQNAMVAGTLLAALDCSDTMVFPFLAEFFLEHGIRESRVGLIFGVTSIGMGLIIPVLTQIMYKIGGPTVALLYGLVSFAIVRVLTACMPFLPDEWILAYSVVVFLITGGVYAFTEVGALTWVLNTAPPGYKVKALATLVGARTVGALFGTPIGGFLFDFIGWVLTNLVGALLILAPLAYHISALKVPERVVETK